MKNEKSPGEDGIPKEFYDKYYHLLEENLSELYNNILLSMEQPQSQKNALIKLLFKKGDHRELKNWRPVSLLNTDYKILSKILTNRIYTVLPMIVPEEQKCGIKGRKMTDVIRNLASYKDHAMNGFFVLVDQAKAFDRVNHEYLFMTIEALGFKGRFLDLTRMLYKDITSQVVVNGQPTNKINIQRGVRQGCPYSMILFGLSTIPLINMIKADKRITGHITKYVRPVKVQSYADDTTIIIGQPQEIKHVFEIYRRHAKASEAAINVEKTQILKLGEHNVPTKLEHDDFTKKVKNKVTVLGAVFCSDKSQETFENLQKATKALEKLQNGNGRFLSLAGKILALNTYVFSTVWNNAWLIDIKNSHFKKFINRIERYLCLYKGNEIMEKVSTSRDKGGLGLINIKERIQAIHALEYLQANKRLPETDNVLFEVGLHQKTIYGTVVAKGANAPQTKELIILLLKNINNINQYTATHKIVKPKNIQDILFPKNKINYFTEIYIPLEPKLVSINYLVLHNLLPIRGGSECKLCKGIEYELKHILFECTALTRVRRHVQTWLSTFNINNFNRETIIEMKNIKDLPNYIISLYKATVWKNRSLAQLREVNEQAVINSLDPTLRFYITHILKE